MTDPIASSEQLQVGEHIYRVGQQVTCKVIKAGTDAITVELPGHVRGIISRDFYPAELKELRGDRIVSRGADVQANIARIDRQKYRLILRDLIVLRDPWGENRVKLKSGAIVRGEIYNIEVDRIFVELDEGIPALIPYTEIPDASYGQIEQVLAIGDLLEAQVIGFRDEERVVVASIRQHLDFMRSVWKKAHGKAEQEERVASSLSAGVAVDTHVPKPGLLGGRGLIKRILMTDDDPQFLDQFHQWLGGIGYEVEVSQSFDEAIELGLERSYDLILMDADLAGKSGIEAAQRISRERPGIAVALVTGDEQLSKQKEVPGVRLVGTIYKFEGVSPIEELIARLETGTEIAESSQKSEYISPEVELLEKMSSAESRAIDLRSALLLISKELCESTKAEACVVFKAEMSTGEVTVETHYGRSPRHDQDASGLRFSPVRDVIVTGTPVFEGRVSETDRRFKHLLNYMSFKSCIGLRIERNARGNNTMRYALFLFHYKPDQFTDSRFQQALLAATHISVVLERNELWRYEEELQTLSVLGLLHSGLLHEVNNQLNDLELSSRNLRSGLGYFKSDLGKVLANETFIGDMDQSITVFEEAVQRLRNIASSYLGLLRTEQTAKLEMNKILDQAKVVAELEARHRVSIKNRASTENLPGVIGVGPRLTRAFANIMLNAVQMMRNYGEGTGIVVISSRLGSRNPQRPIQIRIIDTGPGIHRKDFERIFERGISSRKDGSGLGLYITRGLIESMGGTVRVEDSRMFIGSCFLVELPAVAGSEATHERAIA